MSWPPRGTVYGTLLNFPGEVEAWAPRMNEAPYKAPPKAPVLYVKTANTFSANGSPIPVPAGVREVEIGATVGLVMRDGTTPAACVLMADLSIPHDSYFRPPVKFKCLDGFLGVGLPVERVHAERVSLDVWVNGERRQSVRFDSLVRSPRRLLDDVAGFMTMAEGDVLLLGCDVPRPRVRAGDRFEIRSPELGTLAHALVEEPA